MGAQLVERGIAGIAALDPGGALELLDHRLERTVAVIGQALVAQQAVRAVFQPLAQALDDARLADAGLAGQQHDVALAVTGLLPALEQQGDLVLAADQRRQLARAQRREAVGDGARARARATPESAGYSP